MADLAMARARRSPKRSLLLLLTVFCVSVRAQPPSVEDFFRNAEFTQMKLSPDGNWVGALTSVNNRRNLAILAVDDNRAVAITDGRRTDISDFYWITNDRLVYTIDIDGNEAFGLFGINRDGSEWRELVGPEPGVQVFPHQVLPLDRLEPDPEHMLVTDNARRKLYPDVMKLDIRTGRMTREVQNPGYVTRWLTDHGGVVRVGIGTTEDPRDLITQVLYRDSADDDWRILTEFHQFDDHGFTPLGFAADNRTLYVQSNIGRDTAALYTYDPEAGAITDLVFGRDDVDIERIESSPGDHRLLGVHYEFERPEFHAVDPVIADLKAAIDEALPETLNTIVSISDDEQRMLILAASDVDPGSFYMLDREIGNLRFYASRMPWIAPVALSEMRPVTIPARDGVVLRGYLTIPKNTSGGNLPLILHPHGGPYGLRDSWGFDRIVQFLASRGYAVLQVNYRGSGGYGKRFMDIAWQQWGLSMQDDLTDAVEWAIDTGVADPDRVCIFGASYGGYATMAGITTTPSLYRCAVNYVGVVDIPELYEYWSSGPLSTGIEAWFRRAIGDPRADRERLAETSPINRLDGLAVPLFIVHGRRDPRVPIAQAEALTRALERREIPFELLIKDDEGHGFFKEENNFELYGRLEKFFAEQLKPR
jgi:dipeptidyl aminopeptidase/acylaminoacyl peptidase